MKRTELAALSNLRLAWRRITTGGNHQYKRLFRHLYVAYEVALEANLVDLRERLLADAFTPRAPERIYLPKTSGLHRPITLLHIEDQIVLQAFANLAAKRLYGRRASLQFKVVFSNILQRQTSIFFFERWQKTYRAFQKRIARHFAKGLRWVADFDLAAFYDTVSHQLLLQTIYPRTPMGPDMQWLMRCLSTWSSEHAASRHGHGIPQGPIASDFLAECFLLPIDLALVKNPGYTRYVDDVRLFGKTEDAVRAGVVGLERRCRQHGLIPQAGKFLLKRAASVHEAMGSLPSIADPHRTAAAGRDPLPIGRAKTLLKSAIQGRPYRVRDKTRLRYVLYRAPANSELLRVVLKLIPHHPEHADAMFSYLSTFGPRSPIARSCRDLVAHSPYPYVRGEAWVILTRYLGQPKILSGRGVRALIARAVGVAKQKRPENFTETLGACHFLAAAETAGYGRYSRFLKYQPPLLQSLVADILPDAAFTKSGAVASYLKSEACEPGIAVSGRIHGLRCTLASLGVAAAGLPSQVRNTLAEVGTISSPGGPVDPIAEVLQKRYALTPSRSWHTLLGTEYVHALGMLKFAEAAFDVGMSNWLAHQNSFHHAIFLALQRHLGATGHAAACTTVGSDGRLVDFGSTVDAGGPFTKNCPRVGDVFRAMNARRNQLPSSHPYEKKTQKRARHLTRTERNALVKDLAAALPDFLALMP